MHLPADDDPVRLSGDRRDVLRWTLPLLTLLAWLNLPIVAQQTGVGRLELLLFAAAGVTFAALALMLWRRMIGVPLASWLTLGVLAGMMLERIARLFAGGYFDDSRHSFFMPVFAYLPILYLFCFLLVTPVRTAQALALAAWLAVLCVVGWLSAPYWQQPDRRDSLQAMLLFVGPAHGLLIVLLGVIARRHERVLKRYARIAAAARRAHASVARSEAHFRSVFEVAAVGMSVSDETGRYVRVNQCFADMLGYSVEALLQLRYADVSDPQDLAIGQSLAAQLLAREADGFTSPLRYRHRDGHVVHTQVFGRELAQPPDMPRRFICVVTDLSERHAAEQRILAERRVRDLYFEHMPVGTIEFDVDQRVRRWSPQAERIFGWTEAEAVGQTAEQLGNVLPHQLAPRARVLDSLTGGERDHHFAVVPMAHRSGRPLWVEVHRLAVRDVQGRLQSVVSMCMDVTERQEMLSMLNESEARFRGIFNQAAVGIALLDADGRWLNVNDKLCEILGYTLEEFLQLDFQRVTHPDDLQRDLVLSRAVMDRSIDHYSLEKRYIRRDGSVVWAMLYVRRLEAGGNTPTRFVSVVDDISDRKSAEARIVALNADLEAQVAARTAQLNELLQTGQRRNTELSLTTELGRMLSASADLEEAGKVVTHYLPRIFPLAAGAVYLAGSGAGLFDRRVAWGHGQPGAVQVAVDDCWGLRRAEPHHVEGETDALYCPHAAPHARRHPHLCTPLQTMGRLLGLIELAWGERPDGWAPELSLVKNVAEKIGLAFGNLQLREELRQQATVDALTGLHNRRWLEDYLRARLARHSRDGQGFALMMVDADRFKAINDQHGHDAGDEALRQIAAELGNSLRAEEALARIGGEEFIAVLETDSADQAYRAGERVRQAVAALQIVVDGRSLPQLSVSIGIARFPHDANDLDHVLKRADQALYAAKQNGRNQVSMADGTHGPAMSSHGAILSEPDRTRVA